MLTDIEIAQSAELRPIAEIAAKVGLAATDIEPYGHYKVKVPLEVLNGQESRNGRLVLVTGTSPTPGPAKANRRWRWVWQTLSPFANESPCCACGSRAWDRSSASRVVRRAADIRR